jgi:hypothetical protein
MIFIIVGYGLKHIFFIINIKFHLFEMISIKIKYVCFDFKIKYLIKSNIMLCCTHDICDIQMELFELINVKVNARLNGLK